MRTIIRSTLLFIVTIFVAIWILGSREPAELVATFNSSSIGKDLDSYLANREKTFVDMIPGVNKRIIWHRKINEKTPLSIIYVHGFSATSEEIRPVPDVIAKTLGANLFYTRLAGHGRGSMAMEQPRVADWMNDVAEALEIGRRIGNKMIIISASTGSTLVAATILNPNLTHKIKGLIFVSPNFGIINPLAQLLTWPGARMWAPLIGGKTRKNKPRNPLHKKYWTTSYPTVATIPMAAIVKAVTEQDFNGISIPALFYYSLEDNIVDPQATKEISRKWGGKIKTINVSMTKQDDLYSHIVAGNIVSPNQTRYAIKEMVKWIGTIQ